MGVLQLGGARRGCRKFETKDKKKANKQLIQLSWTFVKYNAITVKLILINVIYYFIYYYYYYYKLAVLLLTM